ncbi:methyltransferase domain protein [Ceratobasidium sp. AG-Ba]|nr:methyltransferase domain protein [Ceratobasidium sp. AG-Ba]
MAITVKHPRYMAGIAAGVVCTMFAPCIPATPIAVFLTKQEDVYEAMVQSRHALIRKYGPTPEKLEAFPKVGSWAKYMLWDFFPASYNCPYETERVGVLGDGGKWVCGLSRLVDKPNCVVYSAGHTFIDILKVDIEGSEFDTLTSMIKYFKERGRPLPFGQLQLEIHADKITFAQFLKWWEDLEEAGLRPFWTEPNLLYTNWFRNAPSYTEYSFLNVGGNHDIIRG